MESPSQLLMSPNMIFDLGLTVVPANVCSMSPPTQNYHTITITNGSGFKLYWNHSCYFME